MRATDWMAASIPEMSEEMKIKNFRLADTTHKENKYLNVMM